MIASTASERQDRKNLEIFSHCTHPRVSGERVVKRPEGYAIPGSVAFSLTAEAAGLEAIGYGEGDFDLARERAISEAYERLALFSYCASNKTSETSSGWAAHVNVDLAIRAAICELIERDVALTAWENGGPFHLIPQSLWPEALQTWIQNRPTELEFSNLQILLSNNQNGACVSALLFNETRNFVAGHASAPLLEDAIISASSECFRAAHSAIQLEYLSEVAALHLGAPGAKALPGAHSLAYAYGVPLPEAIEIKPSTEYEVHRIWSKHQATLKSLNMSNFDVQTFEFGDRVVARVRSPNHRDIFWGRTEDESVKNKHPHFVG